MIRVTPATLARFALRRLRAAWQEFRARRLRYRLTLEGALVIAVTFAIGLAAFNTGANLLYLICSMLLSFLILSGLISTNSLRGLRVSRSAPRYGVAGEPLRVEVTVRNTRRLTTSYSLRVADRLADGQTAGVTYIIAARPRSAVHASYRVIFPKRGLYRLRALALSSRFPFGLIERGWVTTQDHEILVYPRLVDVAPILRRAEVDLGEIESGKRGPGVSLLQLRESTGRDSARLIHWKTTARTGRLMVKEFEKEEKRRVTVFLDNRSPVLAPDEALRDRFERAVTLAASLLKFLLETEHQAQLVTASGKVPFGSGLSHLHRCLRALARLELLPSCGSGGGFGAPAAADAESLNLLIRFAPARPESKFARIAQTLDIEEYFDLLNPVAGAASPEPPPTPEPATGEEARR